MKKLSAGGLPVICGILALLTTTSAHAEWRRLDVSVRPERLLRFTADPTVGLVMLDLRKLTIADPERKKTRRSFTLNSQTDALLDFIIVDDDWWLASRRSIWRSKDKGYSWTKERSRSDKADKEWMGLALINGSLNVLSEQGAEPIGEKRARGTQFGRIRAAASGPGGTAMLTSSGLFVAAGATQTFAAGGLTNITAFYSNGLTHMVAGEKSLLACSRHCKHAAGIPGIRSIVAYEDRYWAASTDAVWQRSEGGAWIPKHEGLGTASPGLLAVYADGLYYLADRALFQWARRPGGASGSIKKPDMRPSIGEVRKMVREAQPLLFQRGDDWSTRVRWKAAAPVLDIGVRRGLDERAALTRGNTIGVSTTENRILLGPDGRSTTRSDSGSWDYSVSMRWDLDDLVFHQHELSVSNEIEDVYRLRESVMLDVTRLYFDRLRAIVSYHEAASTLLAYEALMRVAEVTASLDYYTGGRFSSAVEDDPLGEKKP